MSISDIKEEIIYRYENAKEKIQLFGFWLATWYFVSGIWHDCFWNYVLRIIKIAQWIPILWNDYDWDYGYFLDILKFKLKRMQKALANGHAVDEHNSAKASEIQEVLDLLDQIKENEFCKQEWAIHELKYGELQHNLGDPTSSGARAMNLFYDKTFAIESTDTPDGLESMNDLARTEAMNIHTMEEAKLQAAYDKMFLLIAKHIRGWWD
jgi:hypothetical protein